MKVLFTGPLWVDDWEDQGCWVLLTDLTATVTEDEDNAVQPRVPSVFDIVVPAAFITDFCSVPRMPFIYDIFGNIARKSGALHDWLYTKAEYPREWCDEVLRAALIAQNVSQWKADEMYIAVRMFGSSSYGKKKLKMRGKP